MENLLAKLNEEIKGNKYVWGTLSGKLEEYGCESIEEANLDISDILEVENFLVDVDSLVEDGEYPKLMIEITVTNKKDLIEDTEFVVDCIYKF